MFLYHDIVISRGDLFTTVQQSRDINATAETGFKKHCVFLGLKNTVFSIASDLLDSNPPCCELCRDSLIDLHSLSD